MKQIFVYSSKKNVNCITAMIGAEIRNAIQNWRKENKLPMDFRIPTLYVYFKEEIIKTALIEGITDANPKNPHLFELCLVDNVEFVNPNDELNISKSASERWANFLNFNKHDLIFWSPLGGSIGVCDCLKGNTPNIQKEVDVAIEKEYYNKYV
jgi:hypothetical protein